MVDQASIDKLNLLHPKLRDIAIACYNQACQATPKGVHPYIVQTYRTFAESTALYNQGRTTPGEIVTNAKAGQSWHNWALALDFGLIINGKISYNVDDNWMIVVKIFEAKGFNWGGYFPKGFHDDPHLECKMGQTISGLMNKYEAKEFIPGTTYINF